MSSKIADGSKEISEIRGTIEFDRAALEKLKRRRPDPDSIKVQQALETLDELVDAMVLRPRMHSGGSFHAAESAVGHLLHVRSPLVGGDCGDVRKYYASQYPDVPGPIRCISSAKEQGNHDAAWWSEEMRKFVAFVRHNQEVTSQGS